MQKLKVLAGSVSHKLDKRQPKSTFG